MKIMLAIVIAIILLMVAVAAGAKPGNPVDESDPNLVRKYIAMPCDGLDKLYDYLYNEMVHLTAHYKECVDWAANSDDPYAYLVCYYDKLEWELIFSHAKSVEKSYHLMCDDWGERKNPEYNIDF
jgi:hypothetical protein